MVLWHVGRHNPPMGSQLSPTCNGDWHGYTSRTWQKVRTPGTDGRRARRNGVPGPLTTGLLLVHVAATCAMSGLIWLVQVVHYPLFAGLDAATFPAYHREHMRLITLVVGPLMLVEAAAALAILALRASPLPLAWAGVVLLGVVWGATMFLSVPAHDALSKGFSASALATLVGTNWIRTLAWTARAVVALTMVAAAMGSAN